MIQAQTQIMSYKQFHDKYELHSLISFDQSVKSNSDSNFFFHRNQLMWVDQVDFRKNYEIHQIRSRICL